MDTTIYKSIIELPKTESGQVDRYADNVELDPQITYPSYKSFDDFIDVERLRSLDGYVTQRLVSRLKMDKDLKFYTGPYTLAESAAGRPGSRMVYLSYS